MPNEDREQRGGNECNAVVLDQRVAEVRAEQVEAAVREVEDVEHAEDQREADREHEDQHPERDPVDDAREVLVEEIRVEDRSHRGRDHTETANFCTLFVCIQAASIAVPNSVERGGPVSDEQVEATGSWRVPEARGRGRRPSRAAAERRCLGGHHEDGGAEAAAVGNLLTLSGPNSSPSIDIKRGFATYVKSRNGLGGRKIQFIDADDANNPATAIQQVQKLVDEQGVDVIEGIFFSSILLGVRDTIDQLKVPTVVANAAANALSRDRKSDYIWRTSYSNHQLGVPLGPWAANRIGKSGVAVISANYAAGQESAQAFQARLREGGRQPRGRHHLHAVPDDARLPAVLPAGRRPRRQGRLGVHRRRRRGDQVRQDLQAVRLRQAVPAVRLEQHDRPAELLDAEGDAALGIRTTANWAPTLKNKENVLFLKQYDKFGVGEPSAFAELGYVAAQFLDLALRKVHGDASNKASLIKAMASVGTWLSPGGKVRMDPATHNIIEPVYLRNVVKKGNGYTQPLTATLGIYKEPGA